MMEGMDGPQEEEYRKATEMMLLHVIKAPSIREDMLQSVRVRAMPDIMQHGCNL